MKRVFTLRQRFLLCCLISLFVSQLICSQNTPLPYFNGFETPQDTAGWTFKKRTNTTGFFIGNAVHCLGMNSLYISPDDGATATYGTTSTGYVSVAYKPITLSAGTYNFAFDYQCGGDGTNQDMKVALVPASTNISASSTASYPTTISSNQLTDDRTRNVFGKSAWSHVQGSFVVTASGTFNLCFAFRCNNSSAIAPGACVDNIQIDTVHPDGGCTSIPTNIQVVKDPAAGVIVSWEGNAQQYELMAASVTDPDDHTVLRHTGITDTFDIIQYSELADGQYFIYVRAICGSDTSMYGEIDGVLIYDVSARCIDFVTFDAPGIICTTGTYDNPYANVGYVDNGPSQMSSRHTVHSDLNETDSRTANGLSTVPAGEIMSVRLGNWNAGSQAESVTYTYDVPNTSSVIILLKYAVIFEEPGHDEAPEFLLEIMNVNGVILDAQCTRFNFLCDGTLTNGWHQNGAYWWKEWSTIGVNLTQFMGQTVKIRLTTKDCNYSGHCGYAYYTISCTDAEIDAGSCNTQAPNTISAPEGFTYQWNNVSTGQSVATTRTLTIASGDTCTYSCTCFNVENPACYFIMPAYTKPRIPEASFTYTTSYNNCNTRISFTNTSRVYSISGGMKTYYPGSGLSAQTWTVTSSHTDRPYHNRVSVSPNMPYLDIPEQGDTINVTLTAWRNDCDDDTTITIYVPAIHAGSTFFSRTVCVNEPTVFGGKEYTFIASDAVQVTDTASAAVTYITGMNPIRVFDTIPTWCSCDSIVELSLTGVVADTVDVDTVIASSQQYCIYVVNSAGTVLKDTCISTDGYYEVRVPGTLVSCDSLLYRVNLTVNADLVVVSAVAVHGTVKGTGAYNVGDTVVLNAIPDKHYSFTMWGDGETTNPRTIIVAGDTQFVALFTPDEYTVTVLSEDTASGYVTGGGTYTYGSSVVITAYPNIGHGFTGWDDGVTDNPRTITVEGDTQIVAQFTSAMYEIHVLSEDTTYGTVTGGGTYPNGTRVIITAIPKPGYDFAGWDDDVFDNPRPIIVNGEATYIAYFMILSSVDDAADETQKPVVEKIMIDGVVYIRRDGKLYTIHGIEVK